MEYLGRYTHRVAISNQRIFSIGQHEVTFRVRTDAMTHKKRTVSLAGIEFIRRCPLVRFGSIMVMHPPCRYANSVKSTARDLQSP